MALVSSIFLGLSDEASQSLSAQCIEFLGRMGLPPSPVNYLIAFEYVRGKQADIVREIDRQLAMRGRCDGTAMDILFDRLLACMGETGADDASSEMLRILQAVTDQVAELRGDVSGYREVLQQSQTRLGTRPTRETVQQVAQDLVAATQGVVSNTSRLEAELLSAKQESQSLKTQLENIRKEAEMDILTGQLNRAALERTLDKLVSQADQEERGFTVVMADIDHFKQFNDAYGHLIGDEVLKRVAQALRKQVGGADYVARYGGEEMLVMLPEASLEQAVQVGESMRRSVQEIVMVRRSTKQRLPQVTISLGVGEYLPGEGKTALIERTDAAMYRAKQAGRNLVMTAA